MRAAKSLFEKRDWQNCIYFSGLAVELTIKARICVDLNLPGFPETAQEFKAAKPLDLKVHELEDLLNLTKQAAHIKNAAMNEWTRCLQWSVHVRYEDMNKSTQQSASEMLKAAEIIIRQLSVNPGMEAAVIAETEEPYVKLWALEHELSIEKGAFRLFAIMHRSGSFAGSADLIVSAPWIDSDSLDGTKAITDAVVKTLKGDQIKAISGVMAFPASHPLITAITNCVVGEHVQFNFHNCTFSGVHIDHAMFVTSRRDV